MNGFSSRMKLIIFFICVPLVYSELHRFMSTYTGITGQTAAGIPEFTAVTTLDDQQIDYYNSNIKKLIPKQDWMKDYVSTKLWTEDTEIRQYVQQIYIKNIPLLMQRFNQSHGVHTYQRMYGCEWDDETGDSHGFDEYGYDGEDFISLDMKELRYITAVQQAELTVKKWNEDRTQLESLKQYYSYECVYWLRKFLHWSKATIEKADPPKVSLLQKNPDSPVKCHVTGFLFRNATISWKKNGQAMSNSSKLESGDILPNEDGTFQRKLTLVLPPDEYKESQYTCVVEHKSLTKTIEKTLTVNETKSSILGSDASFIMCLVFTVIITVILVVIALCVLQKHRNKLKSRIRYVKTQHLRQEDEKTQTSTSSEMNLLQK